MLPRASSYAELRSRFRWDIPEFYNIGVDVCGRWAAAGPDRLALIDVGAEGDREFTYGQLRDLSNQTAIRTDQALSRHSSVAQRMPA